MLLKPKEEQYLHNCLAQIVYDYNQYIPYVINKISFEYSHNQILEKYNTEIKIIINNLHNLSLNFEQIKKNELPINLKDICSKIKKDQHKELIQISQEIHNKTLKIHVSELTEELKENIVKFNKNYQQYITYIKKISKYIDKDC